MSPVAPPSASSLPEGLADDPAEAEDGSDGAETRVVQASPAQHGARLDKALAELVPEFSRSYLQQLLGEGGVLVNGRAAAKPSARVQAGDVLSVELRPTPQSQAFRPEAMALDTVYEDEHLRVVNKPAGLVVHPAPGNWSGTLLNGLLALDPRAGNVPRAGIVHRLDKDTSGLMVVARERSVMDALVRMIAAREVSRQYLALGHRAWQGSQTRVVEEAIGRDPRNRLRMAAVDLAVHAGKPARTDIAVLDTCEDGCLVHCTLHTGRTHQIRVHMAWLRHPLVADTLYGGEPAAGMSRQALHAYRLAFAHPVTGQPLLFHAPLPGDMAGALQAWGLRYNPA
ncbi:RluA family pseudouridine synthase [Paracidovorax avenae]|uniref:RluA family pseudouridine synthase n=1 Tax=Paracidovorax avenae TaxID=80867 RepID=UPI000D15C3C1|nr:RluA family pseudouridine synthase [Paracidovorax avenae]AVS70067.1 RluA family pseudouridine synthase [Paracidovorax avenae]